MNNLNKKYIIIGPLLVIVLAISAWFFTRPVSQPKSNTENASVFEEPVEEIPALDNNVEILIKGKTDAEISVSNIPKNTRTITYELSYNTKSGSVEGVFGIIDVLEADKASEKITFGTCSSGVCRYHQIDGSIKGVFIFEGEYGEKMREQEFNL